MDASLRAATRRLADPASSTVSELCATVRGVVNNPDTGPTALERWNVERASRLDEILDLRAKAVGQSRGRKYGTAELNRMLITKLCSEFQGFSRDLHVECRAALAAALPNKALASVISNQLGLNTTLEKKNPTAGAIGADFSRFGLAFIPGLKNQHASNAVRLQRLDRVVTLRNCIVHEDRVAEAERLLISPLSVAKIDDLPDDVIHRPTQLADFKRSRSCLNALASEMTKLMDSHLERIVLTED